MSVRDLTHYAATAGIATVLAIVAAAAAPSFAGAAETGVTLAMSARSAPVRTNGNYDYAPGYYDYAPGYYDRAGPAYVAPAPDYASPYFAEPGWTMETWGPAYPPGCGAGKPHC